jgi:hypothetical protein
MTKALLSATALFLALAGLAATFLPQELLHAVDVPPSGVLPVIVQLAGALYLGFALLDWMARGSTIGGIYNRPVALANQFHFFVGTMALLKASGHGTPLAVSLLAIPYALLTIAFSYLVFFASPGKATQG